MRYAIFAICCLLTGLVHGQGTVTSPRALFGAAIGDDHFLATYAQLEQYWRRLEAESDRVRIVSIGTTEEGRQQWMAIVSAPENLAQLERHRSISRRLALGEAANEDEARVMAGEGRAVVAITGGLHADEVLGAQQLIETVYQLAAGEDEETRRLRRDVITLVVHANPDGHALVANWYMREAEPSRRTLQGLPRAYQKYVGHDNNRDFYLSSQAETINVNRVLYREWFPQIVYDHHQPGPPGTVMFAPPFRGAYSEHVDPLLASSVDLIGTAMHARFAAEGKRGVTTREGGPYTAWWNGGLRTAAYFHNQIGLLTETIGTPTPTAIPFVAARQTATRDLPLPIAPQPWRFHQSIAYSLTANRAVLATAAEQRESLLLNAYRMARRAITAGTTSYVISANQPDFPTAVKFVDALVKSGVMVHRATGPVTAVQRTYPAGTFVVSTAQPFRAHVLDMFEPQMPPFGPDMARDPAADSYDVTGWTLAIQMGVQFDRIAGRVDGPLELATRVTPIARAVGETAADLGYLIDHHQNDSAILVNRLLRANVPVYWPRDRSQGGAGGTGAMYVERSAASEQLVRQAAADLGIGVRAVAVRPPGGALRIGPVRTALWDQYGGASSSGWIRWILEKFEFPIDRVYPQRLDAGGLLRDFDVIVLPDEAVPGVGRETMTGVPAEYRHTTGVMTWERSVPRLREFVEAGGTVIAIGDATRAARALGAAVQDRTASLPAALFSIPGALVRVAVDNTHPVAYGMPPAVDVMADNSPAFVLPAATNLAPVAWFADAEPLRSGWARGAHLLQGTAAVVDAAVGRGRVVIVGPEIVFRGQSHAAFKLLFNAILRARAEEIPRLDAAGAAGRASTQAAGVR